jgi:hypothetical protein
MSSRKVVYKWGVGSAHIPRFQLSFSHTDKISEENTLSLHYTAYPELTDVGAIHRSCRDTDGTPVRDGMNCPYHRDMDECSFCTMKAVLDCSP